MQHDLKSRMWLHAFVVLLVKRRAETNLLLHVLQACEGDASLLL